MVLVVTYKKNVMHTFNAAARLFSIVGAVWGKKVKRTDERNRADFEKLEVAFEGV